MKFVVFTLGCKVNETESQSIANDLRKLGHEVSEELEKADAYIINTCAVTNEAARKSRQCLSRVAALNANAPIFVVGCASQANPAHFEGHGMVRLVRGTSGKGSVAQAVLDVLEGRVQQERTQAADYEDDIFSHDLKQKKYIKIHDGCNNYCSYCIVPYLRGASRSRSAKSIIEEAIRVEGKEIVLTGINICDYRGENGEELADLVQMLAVVNAPKSLASLEIRAVSERLLNAMRQSGFLPKFHLSLQSCSNSVLDAMNRKYTFEQALQCVSLIREHFKDAIITADLIAGFPTETEQMHTQSLENVKKLGLNGAHIFPFSMRSGTKAQQYPDLPKLIKVLRAKQYRDFFENNKNS